MPHSQRKSGWCPQITTSSGILLSEVRPSCWVGQLDSGFNDHCSEMGVHLSQKFLNLNKFRTYLAIAYLACSRVLPIRHPLLNDRSSLHDSFPGLGALGKANCGYWRLHLLGALFLPALSFLRTISWTPHTVQECPLLQW